MSIETDDNFQEAEDSNILSFFTGKPLTQKELSSRPIDLAMNVQLERDALEDYKKGKKEMYNTLLALNVDETRDIIRNLLLTLVGIRTDLENYLEHLDSVSSLKREPFITSFNYFVHDVKTLQKVERDEKNEDIERLFLKPVFLQKVFDKISEGEEGIVALDIWQAIFVVKNDLKKIQLNLPESGQLNKNEITQDFLQIKEGLIDFFIRIAGSKNVKE